MSVITLFCLPTLVHVCSFLEAVTTNPTRTCSNSNQPQQQYESYMVTVNTLYAERVKVIVYEDVYAYIAHHLILSLILSFGFVN